MASTTCKRKASEELFMQPKKIILKELAQNSLLANGLTSNGLANGLNTLLVYYMWTPKKCLDCLVADLMPECPTDNRVAKYCDYLVNNYTSEDSTFTPCLWACNSASILLTTNACESFYSFFNDRFYSNSPPILSWLNFVRNFVHTARYIYKNQ